MSARRMTVGAADDPYKKYWWGILAGFIVTGAWLCLPIMETPVGSVHVDTRAKAGGDAAAEQSLDSADNPSGAPGGALDLSMDGAKRKSKSGDADDMTSMLYSAPVEPGAAAAAGKPLGDASAASASSSLAQQLKDAGKKADASGWNEKAQRGFSSPHLAGASLPGFGSTSGGAGASAGGGNGAFGTHNASVGFESAKGLRDDGAPEPGLQALRAAAGKSGPNLAGSAEGLKSSSGRTFDGSRGKGGAAADIGTGAMQQANALYDAAPANLKANDPKIDQKKLPDPPAAPTPQSAQSNSGQQMAMMIGMAIVGGMVGGVAGQMIASVGAQMIQMQQQQAAEAAAQKAQQQQAQKPGWPPHS
jgi:hypothetical protein